MCNTSAAQNFVLQGSREVLSTPISMQTVGIAAAELTKSHTPLDVSDAVTHWYHIFSTVLGALAPPGKMSIFIPSVVRGDLSSLRLAYYGLPVFTIANN